VAWFGLRRYRLFILEWKNRTQCACTSRQAGTYQSFHFILATTHEEQVAQHHRLSSPRGRVPSSFRRDHRRLNTPLQEDYHQFQHHQIPGRPSNSNRGSHHFRKTITVSVSRELTEHDRVGKFGRTYAHAVMRSSPVSRELWLFGAALGNNRLDFRTSNSGTVRRRSLVSRELRPSWDRFRQIRDEEIEGVLYWSKHSGCASENTLPGRC